MTVTQQTFDEIALENPKGRLELHRGQIREKPLMSVTHNWSMRRLGWQLSDQLDPNEFEVIVDSGRLRRTDDNNYIPDVMVVPAAEVRRLLEHPYVLEVYERPLPLLAEVWSPSTGNYDIGEKLEEYQRRGDLEIWRLHPFERSLTAWRRQSDGTYTVTVFRGGTVQPIAFPHVTIDLDALWPPI